MFPASLSPRETIGDIEAPQVTWPSQFEWVTPVPVFDPPKVSIAEWKMAMGIMEHTPRSPAVNLFIVSFDFLKWLVGMD